MTISTVYIYFLLTISIVSMSKFPMTEAGTIDLIHRESPHSPSYDSTLMPWQHSVNALRRSFNRLNHFQRIDYSTQSPTADIISDGGEFFLKFSIGTPQVPILATFDTSSSLIWTQCLPCIKCVKQNHPIFTPSHSSTYRKLACNSFLCKAFRGATCDKASKSCIYSESYADGSFSSGDFVTETITLGSTNGRKISIPNVAIGCGRKNGGTSSGIAGFGFGKVSLISQLGSSGQGKFSYCLVSFLSQTSNSSRLHFGHDAVVFGGGVVSTPIVLKPDETLYYLTLEGIGVGNKRFNLYDPSTLLNARSASREGNIIIDAGTTLTFLPSNLYNNLEKEIASSIKVRRIKDPQGVLNLCYHSPNDIKVPTITFHFKGADVKLNTFNTFVRTSETALCFAFAPAKGIPIFGNLVQVNFLVGYDLNKKTISFKATDCSKS